jgi:hypothetical protein
MASGGSESSSTADIVAPDDESSDGGGTDDAGSESTTGDDSTTGGSTTGETPNACSHDPCTVGGPLVPTCHACAAQVCSADDYCCTVSWDLSCAEAYAACAGSC